MQTLTWSVEGTLETVEVGGDVTDYDYTADGSRLTRTDPDGTVTAYLPGMEVVNHPNGTLTASRYYSHGGQQVAVRTDDDSVYWLASDHQGTTTATVEAVTHDTNVRYHDLYGNERGTPVASWVDDHGFLNGVQDPSGLIHLGAREYDPLLGRFISADPVLDLTDSQQMGGYAYANHSPVSFADPTGLFACIDGDCSYHNPDGSLRTDCHKYVGTVAACGRGFGSPVASDLIRAVADEERDIDQDLKADAERAQDILNTSIVDVVIEVGADILLDLIGVNDIMSCVGAGDMLACASLLMDLIPWTKILKLGAKLFKAAKKIYKAVTGFQDKLAWARDTMRRYRDAVSGAWDRARRKVNAQRADAPSCDIGNSFTAGTKVAMADGTSKAIDELEPGDEVLAADEETGQTTTREVVATIEGTGERILVDLGLDTDGDGETDATVTATDRHPIWAADPAEVAPDGVLVRAQTELLTLSEPASGADGSGSGGGGPPPAVDAPLPGQWVDAIELQVGQLLRTGTGTWVQISSVDTRTEHTLVYNLTVADLHTYHVLAGDTPVLVHNCGGKATVRWDQDMEHATIRIEGGGESLETEQVIEGWDGVGSPNGFPTTARVAAPLGPNVVEHTFDVPDVAAALRAQRQSIGADLGPYEGIHNSCVTYCVSIMRAGGIDIPAGARGMIALRKILLEKTSG